MGGLVRRPKSMYHQRKDGVGLHFSIVQDCSEELIEF